MVGTNEDGLCDEIIEENEVGYVESIEVEGLGKKDDPDDGITIGGANLSADGLLEGIEDEFDENSVDGLRLDNPEGNEDGDSMIFSPDNEDKSESFSFASLIISFSSAFISFTIKEYKEISKAGLDVTSASIKKFAKILES